VENAYLAHPPWAVKIYGRRRMTTQPNFLVCQHPKASITPTREAVEKLLRLGFAGQRKVNGRRAQIHIPATGNLVAFTRQGKTHTQKLPPATIEHLTANFRPKSGWTILDAEYQVQEQKVYLFDVLRVGPLSLLTKNYEQRYDVLREQFTLGPGMGFLSLIRDLTGCMAMLSDPSPFTEGLVFREVKSPGFHDSQIIRCRKNGVFYVPEKLT